MSIGHCSPGVGMVRMRSADRIENIATLLDPPDLPDLLVHPVACAELHPGPVQEHRLRHQLVTVLVDEK